MPSLAHRSRLVSTRHRFQLSVPQGGARQFFRKLDRFSRQHLVRKPFRKVTTTNQYGNNSQTCGKIYIKNWGHPLTVCGVAQLLPDGSRHRGVVAQAQTNNKWVRLKLKALLCPFQQSKFETGGAFKLGSSLHRPPPRRCSRLWRGWAEPAAPPGRRALGRINSFLVGARVWKPQLKK